MFMRVNSWCGKSVSGKTDTKRKQIPKALKSANVAEPDERVQEEQAAQFRNLDERAQEVQDHQELERWMISDETEEESNLQDESDKDSGSSDESTNGDSSDEDNEI
jgi:hypothetical protein